MLPVNDRNSRASANCAGKSDQCRLGRTCDGYRNCFCDNVNWKMGSTGQDGSWCRGTKSSISMRGKTRFFQELMTLEHTLA
jgi:hypothetical protein